MKYIAGLVLLLFLLSQCEFKSKECVEATKEWKVGKKMYANSKDSWSRKSLAKSTKDAFILKNKACR
jgi:hypothetical protein